MSSVSPNTPIAGSGYVQHEVGRVLETDRNQQSSAARATERAIDHKADSVDETDNDRQVFTDSEGTGSMGRYLEGDAEQKEEDKPEEPDPDAPPDQTHIDLQA